MIRNTNFLTWFQKSSWMESMKGFRYSSMVKKENTLFKKMLEKVSTVSELKQKNNEFEKAHGSMFFQTNNILIKLNSDSDFEISLNDYTYNVSDFDIVNNTIYYLRDVGHGSQNYTLECNSGSKIVWQQNNIGSQVAVYDDICYTLGVKNKLWYNSLKAFDAKSGRLLKILYEEFDPKYNLRLFKGENALFLIREKSGEANLYSIEKLEVKEISTATTFYPIGFYKNRHCYFKNIDNTWIPVGFECKHFSNNIEYASIKDDILILRNNGKKRIYNFKFKLLYSFYGNIYFHPLIHKTEFINCFIDFTNAGIVEVKDFSNICVSPYCDLYEESCISSDKTKISYLVAYPKCKANKLIVIGYGAYGIPSPISTRRWKPYLDDGWILCFTFIRGGGDKDIKFWLDARTVYKERSVEDFEACIYDCQKKYTISASNTCIHGRSAGGYLVGMAVSRNPSGDLFKIAYTEVPYVDVLNTTSNPKLPLTALEYDEFGDPTRSISEFEKILRLSPVDSLNYNEPPDLYVLIRTSENDSQVYTYESYKWLEALRGKYTNDTRKLLYNSKSSGHFIYGNDSFSNFSEDFFLLKSFRSHASE